MPMQLIAPLLTLFSILIPAKIWVAPNQPLNVPVKADSEIVLVLTDFGGKTLEPKGSAKVAAGQTVDVKQIFPQVSGAGTYLLYATMSGSVADFVGTPLVINVRPNPQTIELGQPMVTRLS